MHGLAPQLPGSLRGWAFVPSWWHFKQPVCFFQFQSLPQGKAEPIARGAERANLVKKQIVRCSLWCSYEILCPRFGTKGRKRGMLKKSLWTLIYSQLESRGSCFTYRQCVCRKCLTCDWEMGEDIAFTACSVLNSFLYMNPWKTGSINKVINWERLVVIPLFPQ